MSRVVHFEIHAENPERAVAFYKGVFDWTITSWPGAEYWLIKTGPDGTRGIDGGLMRRRGPAPTDGQAVNAYACTIQVSSVDEFATKISNNGGMIVVPKMPIAGVGWLAYAKDTEGNIFGIMHPDPAAK